MKLKVRVKNGIDWERFIIDTNDFDDEGFIRTETDLRCVVVVEKLEE